MQATREWEFLAEGDEAIAVDRRINRRYNLKLDLRWKLIRRKKVVEQGTGVTLDISSGGVLFEPGRHLAHGHTTELSISWPALLNGASPLQLVVFGPVVRADGGRAAIRITQHEFKTLSLKTSLAKAAAAATGSSNSQQFRVGTSLGKIQ
jgi:hypothetical protein